MRALPATEITTDIHCVTKWSKFDTVWKGVLLRDLFDRAGRLPSAHHVIMHAEYGYTANVPLEDIARRQLLARLRVRRAAPRRRAWIPGADR